MAGVCVAGTCCSWGGLLYACMRFTHYILCVHEFYTNASLLLRIYTALSLSLSLSHTHTHLLVIAYLHSYIPIKIV